MCDIVYIWCQITKYQRAVQYRLAAPLWSCATRRHTPRVGEFDVSAVVLKSKVLTFTRFFFYISLTRHNRKRFASALVARAPFRDFRSRATLGSGDV